MPTFNNLSELKKYIDSQRGQSGLLDDSQVAKVLSDAGRTLETYLKEEFKSYTDSYSPVVYQRTGYTMQSITVGTPRKLNDNEWSLEITFNDGLANHPSYISQDQPDGYTPWLMSVGWRTKLDSSLNIENFTRFKGTNFVTKAVSRFNSNNPYGLKVEIYYNGSDVTDKTWSYGK